MLALLVRELDGVDDCVPKIGAEILFDSSLNPQLWHSKTSVLSLRPALKLKSREAVVLSPHHKMAT